MTHLKKCTKCGEAKPATKEFFHTCLGKIKAACKDCVKVGDRKRANEWYSNNKERALNNVRGWRSGNQDKIRQYRKDWESRNPEQVIDNMRRKNRINHKKHKDTLDDRYMRTLFRNVYDVQLEVVPQYIIKEKKETIKLKRTINEKQREIRASGNYGRSNNLPS